MQISSKHGEYTRIIYFTEQTRYLRYFVLPVLQHMSILLPVFILLVWIHTSIYVNFN